MFDMFRAVSRTLASALSWGMSELKRNEKVYISHEVWKGVYSTSANIKPGIKQIKVCKTGQLTTQ
jgi:hypothetical protein